MFVHRALLLYICAIFPGIICIVDDFSPSLLGQSYVPQYTDYDHSVQAPRPLTMEEHAVQKHNYGYNPRQEQFESNNDALYEDGSYALMSGESSYVTPSSPVTSDPYDKYSRFWRNRRRLSDNEYYPQDNNMALIRSDKTSQYDAVGSPKPQLRAADSSKIRYVQHNYDTVTVSPEPRYAAMIGKSGLDISQSGNVRNPWSFYDKPPSPSKPVKVYDARDGYHKVYKTPAAKVYQSMYDSYVQAPKSYQTYDKRILKTHAKSLPSYYAEKMGQMLTDKIVLANQDLGRSNTIKSAKSQYANIIPATYNDYVAKSYVKDAYQSKATLPVIHPVQANKVNAVLAPKPVTIRSPTPILMSTQRRVIYQKVKQPLKYQQQKVKLQRVSRQPVLRYSTQAKPNPSRPVITYYKQGSKHSSNLGHSRNDVHYKLSVSPKEQEQTQVIGPKYRNPYTTDPCTGLPEGDYVLQGQFLTLFPYARPLCSFVKCSNFRAHLNPCSTGTMNYSNGTGFCSVLDLVGQCGYSMNSGRSV